MAPKTRDGRDVVITIPGPTWKHGTLDGGGYNWNSSGKSVTKFEGADLIPLSELAPTVTDRMKLGQPCQSCTGWQRIDTLRCIRCSEWSHQNYAPLSELATCKESLRVQNVSQEDPTMLNQPKKTEAEYGWVIERGDSPVSAPLYFMAITGKKEAAWSVHHLSAVRFC